jgi:small-conductance mechanosensitive channel
VKSKVMFAIWDALQEADIGIPFPQRDIYIKELPEQHEAAGPALHAPHPSPSGAG